MARKTGIKNIQALLAAHSASEAPKAERMLGELRSDYGIPTSVVLPPNPPDDTLIVVWEYVICVPDLDPFHAFLNTLDKTLSADVRDLKAGATYYGTYAEAPYFTKHRTYWAYSSPGAVDDFKKALHTKKGQAVLNAIATLLGHVDCCCGLSLHRYYRAGLLKDFVKKTRGGDPILDILAGGGKAKK